MIQQHDFQLKYMHFNSKLCKTRFGKKKKEKKNGKTKAKRPLHV